MLIFQASVLAWQEGGATAQDCSVRNARAMLSRACTHARTCLCELGTLRGSRWRHCTTSETQAPLRTPWCTDGCPLSSVSFVRTHTSECDWCAQPMPHTGSPCHTQENTHNTAHCLHFARTLPPGALTETWRKERTRRRTAGTNGDEGGV